MKKIIITVAWFLLAVSLYAQTIQPVKNGTIEFEKSINTTAIMKSSMAEPITTLVQYGMDNYKVREPQFKKLKSIMLFSRDKSLFTPAPDYASANILTEHPYVSQFNTVYSDLTAGKSVSEKKVFEETFLVEDITRKIEWKITSETREIAGFTCRRANAIIMDSIFVVAFYTGDIPVSGGPESFTGLPGMILGVALPHENITWFATKVTPASSPSTDLKPPAKGKMVNNKELRITLEQVLKPKGAYAQIYLKGLLL